MYPADPDETVWAAGQELLPPYLLNPEPFGPIDTTLPYGLDNLFQASEYRLQYTFQLETTFCY